MRRKVEKEVALDHALTLFWDRGYRATSLDMLTYRLGVEKPSLYASFGNKHQFFLTALRHYRTWLIGHLTALFEGSASARAGLERVVRATMSAGARDTRKGCFAANSAMELAESDAEVLKEVQAAFEDFLALLTRMVRAAQTQGEVRNDVPAHSLARLLLHVIEGARILDKAKMSDRDDDTVTRLLLSVLDGR